MKQPHSNRAEHGWSPVPEIQVSRSRRREWTRGEIAGFAASEAKVNRLLDHGDRPGDLFWTNELARLDATQQESAA